jgi:hypothetical protein
MTPVALSEQDLRLFRSLVIAIACSVLAGGVGCGNSAKSSMTDGGAGQGGAAGTTGTAGTTGAGGKGGATGAAGTTGTGGAAGTVGSAGSTGAAGAGPVDAGSSRKMCHTNAECTPPEVCYIGAGSAVICSGPAGACVRMTSPCTSADKCSCLDVPAGSCTGVSGSQGCLGQDAGSSCWVCVLPV